MHDDEWLALIKERHTFGDQPLGLGDAIIVLVVILGLMWLWADAVIFNPPL